LRGFISASLVRLARFLGGPIAFSAFYFTPFFVALLAFYFFNDNLTKFSASFITLSCNEDEFDLLPKGKFFKDKRDSWLLVAINFNF
jgi:hypothetical protein